MSRQSRRTFLKRTAAASVVFPAFTIAGTKASGRVIGANDTVNVGVVGIRGRGGSHVGAFAGMKNVQVTYLVDVDETQFPSRKSQVKAKGGNEPTCVQDVRQALEDKNLDAISIATCNHTHSLFTIWAAQAGKDVYVEKPLSHNVYEGRKLVEAARRYKRIVQHGTQQRSDGGRARQIAAIQSGKYGKLLVSKGYCCKPRWSIGFKKPEAPPATLDFNLWLGPAPEQPYHRNLVHYNWHWFWDTGNGDVGNQGVHEMDVARWAIKGATLPKSVWAVGGRFGYKDQGQTPNTQLAVYDYGETKLVFETRGLVGKHKNYPRNVGNEFYTSEGVIKGWKFYPNGSDKGESLSGGAEVSVTPGGPFGAFIAAVRSRKLEDVNAEALDGHCSAALCHLGNISQRLGKEVPFESISGAGDKGVIHDALETLIGNVRTVEGEDAFKGSLCQAGRTLRFDAETERFIGDDDANALLTRKYRKPFVVPETV